MIYDRNWRSVERDRQLLVHVNNEPVKNSFSKIEQRSEEKNNFSSDFEFAEILFNILIKKKKGFEVFLSMPSFPPVPFSSSVVLPYISSPSPVSFWILQR